MAARARRQPAAICAEPRSAVLSRWQRRVLATGDIHAWAANVLRAGWEQGKQWLGSGGGSARRAGSVHTRTDKPRQRTNAAAALATLAAVSARTPLPFAAAAAAVAAQHPAMSRRGIHFLPYLSTGPGRSGEGHYTVALHAF